MTLFKKFHIPPAKVANPANNDEGLATLATLATGQAKTEEPEISGLATLAGLPSLLVSMSTRAGHTVYVATDDKALANAPKDKPVFSATEIEKMKEMEPEMVDAIVHAKATFPGAILTEYSKLSPQQPQPGHSPGSCYWSRKKEIMQ